MAGMLPELWSEMEKTVERMKAILQAYPVKMDAIIKSYQKNKLEQGQKPFTRRY